MSKKKRDRTGKKQNTTHSPTTPSISAFSPAGVTTDLAFKKPFWISFAMISLITLIMSVVTGVNEDEKFHYDYSDHLVEFYKTGGKDKSALFVDRGKMHYYGGFVDVVTRIATGIFQFDQQDNGFHIIRHLLLACIGILAFLFTGLTGMKTGGWRLGLLAMVLLFLTPRFLGHTAMNPRDMPFAAGYIMAVYFMISFFDQLPKVKKRTIAGLAAGLALALGARSGALLLVAYFGLFGLIHMWRSAKEGEKIPMLKYILPGGIAVLSGYITALIFWPFGLVSPVTHVLESIRAFSNYATSLRMLFQGDMVWSFHIPAADYIATWLGIGLPLAVLIGTLLFFIFSKGIVKKHGWFRPIIFLWIFLFPLVYIIYKQSNLYCSMRHILFVIPPICLLSAIGWNYIIEKTTSLSRPLFKYGIYGMLGILLMLPASHIASNFKTTYVYFNELIGGVKGAMGKYELDYWGVSIKEAVQWMDDEGLLDGQEEITIASNYAFVLNRYLRRWERDHISYEYVRFRERYKTNWDYAIFVNHFIDGPYLRGDYFPDGNVIKTFGKGKTPFVLIYQNPNDRLATQGFQALAGGDANGAISFFEREITTNPNNEMAYAGKGEALMQQNRYEEAIASFRQALAINPADVVSLHQSGLAYLNLGQGDEALRCFEQAEKHNSQDAAALYYQAVIYAQKQDFHLAIQKIEGALQINPGFQQARELYAQLTGG